MAGTNTADHDRPSGHRPAVHAAALSGGFTLPVLPEPIIRQNTSAMGSALYERFWTQHMSKSGCAVIEAALQAGVITPAEVLEIPEADDAAKARVDLVTEACRRPAAALRIRVGDWLAKHGLSLFEHNEYVVFAQDGGPSHEHAEDAYPLIELEHSGEHYYKFSHIPPRLKRDFEIMVHRLQVSGSPRAITDDFLEMGMMGEELNELSEMLKAHDDDADKLWQSGKVHHEHKDCPLEVIYIGADETEAREQYDFYIGWCRELDKVKDTYSGFASANRNPVKATRKLRDRLKEIAIDASPEELRWIEWFKLGLTALRFSARHRVAEAGPIDPSEIADTQPLEYTSLLDFDRPWCDHIVQDISEMVYSCGEQAVDFYSAETAEDVRSSCHDIVRRMVLDAVIQAAVALNDALIAAHTTQGDTHVGHRHTECANAGTGQGLAVL